MAAGDWKRLSTVAPSIRRQKDTRRWRTRRWSQRARFWACHSLASSCHPAPASAGEAARRAFKARLRRTAIGLGSGRSPSLRETSARVGKGLQSDRIAATLAAWLELPSNPGGEPGKEESNAHTGSHT